MCCCVDFIFLFDMCTDVMCDCCCVLQVDFVKERLDQGMDVHQVVHEVCNRCVANDPRTSTGIGSDNMTCLIVLLNQNTSDTTRSSVSSSQQPILDNN